MHLPFPVSTPLTEWYRQMVMVELMDKVTRTPKKMSLPRGRLGPILVNLVTGMVGGREFLHRSNRRRSVSMTSHVAISGQLP